MHDCDVIKSHRGDMSSSSSAEDEEAAADCGQGHSKRNQAMFRLAKRNALGKRDKSSAGAIDPRAVSICATINGCRDWFTTSSCSGRCYMWRGDGNKATNEFARGRMSHDLVDASYFLADAEDDNELFRAAPLGEGSQGAALWLRFEPFILHVRCRTASAASTLCRCARSAFKNVGVQSCESLVAVVVGDEGLEMPLRGPTGERLLPIEAAEWLVDVINEKHYRNWAKTERFERAVRDALAERHPRRLRYDIVGDVAIVRASIEPTDAEAILQSDKKLRIVAAAPDTPLEGSERIGTLRVVAGAKRSPLMTTHIESNVAFVIDLDRVFFSPRMARERRRIADLVRPAEHVLSLFAGCGPEALVIAACTECERVVALDCSPVAISCCRRGVQILERCKPDRARIVHVFEADILDSQSFRHELSRSAYDRIIAPRPKDGLSERDHGLRFLLAILDIVALSRKSVIVHWTDFVAASELPTCQRTREFLARACQQQNFDCEFLYSGRAGPSVAKRQYRVTVDFRAKSRNLRNLSN